MFVYGYGLFDKNQTKLIVKSNDYNVQKDHIARFIVKFIEESIKKMDIKLEEKKDDKHSFNIVQCYNYLFMIK